MYGTPNPLKHMNRLTQAAHNLLKRLTCICIPTFHWILSSIFFNIHNGVLSTPEIRAQLLAKI